MNVTMDTVTNDVLMSLEHLPVAVEMAFSWDQTGSPARVSHGYSGATFLWSMSHVISRY